MKQIIVFLCTIVLLAGCGSKICYTKDHLKKISWIEGNWKGMDGTNPFYEIYKFANDSTIEITSYEWNGTDSSKSSKSLLLWKEGRYYLGNDLNYSVTEITDNSISMDPNNKANNSILWTTKDANTWIATLKTKSTEKTYTMERINHFAK